MTIKEVYSLKAIYTCKMYRSSNRKDKIKAAMNNPLNKELVQQLKEYLDYEVTPDEPEVEVKSKEINPENNKQPSSTPSHAPVSHTSPSARPATDAMLDGMFVDEDDKEEHITPDDVVDDTEDTVDTESNEGTDDEIKESVEVNSCSITSSTDVVCNAADRVNEIKGALNAREDTAGINRIICKNNEMWVYYNDSINLNNVMGPVIELLNASNYTYLEFNRLARSDNAIVFQINDSITEPVKPLEGTADNA